MSSNIRPFATASAFALRVGTAARMTAAPTTTTIKTKITTG